MSELMPLNGFKINRKARIGQHELLEVFEGLENVKCLKKLFGSSTEKILKKLKLGIRKKPWYMWVEKKGRVMIGEKYLRKGKSVYIYLDTVHELAHIRQLRKGLDLWGGKYHYVDMPTEIEAYRFCVAEAKRLGMNRKEIQKYLYMSWLNDAQFKRLLKHTGME